MKKLSAISLLLLFVFNTIGYKLWMEFVIDVADLKLETKFDNGKYNDADLVAMKIPLNLPYNTNWNEFERVDGEITVGNIIYKYVKQKVQNDTLIVMCIPHDSKIIIQQNAADYFGKVNGAPANDNSKKAEIFKKQFSDYDYNDGLALASLTVQSNLGFLHNNTHTAEEYISLDEQPPDNLV